MFYVYILYSEKFDKFYIGQTADFDNRLQRHNKGYEKATSPYIPWEMLLYLEKNSRKEAMELEKKLKNLSKNRIMIFIEKYRRCWRGVACQHADLRCNISIRILSSRQKPLEKSGGFVVL